MNKQFKVHRIPTARAVQGWNGGGEYGFSHAVYDYIYGFVQPPLTPSVLSPTVGGFFWAQGEWVLFTQDKDYPHTQVEVDDYKSTENYGPQLYEGGAIRNTVGPTGTVLRSEVGVVEAGEEYRFSYTSVVNTGTFIVEIGNTSTEINVSETSSFKVTPSIAGDFVIKVGDSPLSGELTGISCRKLVSSTTTGKGYEEVEDYIWWKNQWLRVTGEAEWTKMGRRFYRVLRVIQTASTEGNKQSLRVPPPSFEEVSGFIEATNSLEIQMEFTIDPKFNTLIDKLEGM